VIATTPAVAFLHSLAHACATLVLYGPRHPARAAAVDEAYGRLLALRESGGAGAGTLRFSFLDEAVIAGDVPLHEMREWPWAARLSRAGIQRLEVDPGCSRHGLECFLEDVLARTGVHGRAEESSVKEEGGVRWGAVGIRDDERRERAPAAGRRLRYRLGEEVAIVAWLFDQAATGGEVPRDEVELVVASLVVAMQEERATLDALLEHHRDDPSGAARAINGSVLAMALAERLGFASPDVRAVGAAALLRDVGMSAVPAELRARRWSDLAEDERALVAGHTGAGARLLLARRGEYDLAAIVAYEHHLRPDGEGWPALPDGREPHYVSRLVRACDAYLDLRDELGPEEALEVLDRWAGRAFDAGVARTLVELLRARA